MERHVIKTLLLVIGFLILTQVSAADFSGTFQITSSAGGGVLTLQQNSANGEIKGTFSTPNRVVESVAGRVNLDGSMVALVKGNSGSTFIRGVLAGKQLNLTTMAAGADGMPDMSTTAQLVMQRTSAASTAPGGTNGVTVPPEALLQPDSAKTSTVSGQVLAQGMGGTLTLDNANAYVDALQFCL